MISLSFAVSLAFIFDVDGSGKKYIRQVFTGILETESNIPLLIRDRIIKGKFNHNHKLTSDAKRNMLINGYKAYLSNKEYSRMPPDIFKTPTL